MKYLVFLLLLISVPFFYFKLGQSSLVSWDEAWYAGIAKNIADTGDILRLHWNGVRFADHPPVGFLAMALSLKIFGNNEFWVRFPSATAGLASLIAVYLLGKELINKWVGAFSIIGLISSPWFLYRARSGNLDVFLVLLFLLSLLFSVRYIKNDRFGYPLLISLSLLFLTKTMVGFAIFPVLVFLFWGKWKKMRLILVSLIPFIVWFGIQYFTYDDYVSRFFSVGARGIGQESSYLDNLRLFKEYLHSGVGRWFWIGIFSLPFAPPGFIVFFVFFALPFIFSAKGHIWHLLPLHPILVLSALGAMNRIIKWPLILFFLTIIISYTQIKRNWYEIIDIPAYVSDEEILSTEAGRFPYKFYIDGDFVPAAVYYSGKDVEQIAADGIKQIFVKNEPFVLITNEWRLNEAGVSARNYRIVRKDRDKILLIGNNE